MGEGLQGPGWWVGVGCAAVDEKFVNAAKPLDPHTALSFLRLVHCAHQAHCHAKANGGQPRGAHRGGVVVEDVVPGQVPQAAKKVVGKGEGHAKLYNGVDQGVLLQARHGALPGAANEGVGNGVATQAWEGR